MSHALYDIKNIGSCLMWDKSISDTLHLSHMTIWILTYYVECHNDFRLICVNYQRTLIWYLCSRVVIHRVVVIWIFSPFISKDNFVKVNEPENPLPLTEPRPVYLKGTYQPSWVTWDSILIYIPGVAGMITTTEDDCPWLTIFSNVFFWGENVNVSLITGTTFTNRDQLNHYRKQSILLKV